MLCYACMTVTLPKFKEGRRAENVTAVVLIFLVNYNCLEGVAVMASGLNRVHAKVKMKIPLALLILCSPYLNLNVALNQGAAKMREIFFSHLTGLSEFFSRSPKPVQLLDDTCQRLLPRVSPTG